MSAPTRPRGPQISVDLLASVTLFLIAGVLLTQTGHDARDWAMPRALNYLLIGVGLVLLVKGLVRPGDKVPLVPAVARRQGLDTAFFMAVAVVYALAIPALGFWISSAVVLFVLSLTFAERRDLRTVLQSTGTAVGVCAAAYLLMQHVFYVPLPAGSIFG
jgi:Tripartite tricarboxylate transporter TctB family